MRPWRSMINLEKLSKLDCFVGLRPPRNNENSDFSNSLLSDFARLLLVPPACRRDLDRISSLARPDDGTRGHAEIPVVADDLAAVHDNAMNALRVGIETRPASGHVGTRVDRAAGDLLRIEYDNVGVSAWLQHAAILETDELSRPLGELMNRLFEGRNLELAHGGLDEAGGERKGIDHVKMRAGIRGADDGARILPHLGAGLQY